MGRSSEDEVVVGQLEATDGSFAPSDGRHLVYGLGEGERSAEAMAERIEGARNRNRAKAGLSWADAPVALPTS